ncbi:sensor histidine kinase [Agromyces sp. MMS24-JH15]|uniref:sensor histidine kinase n=1 Tax=Agromyces sp. MMS24-JH15 TaxID=3243765 RepID=UPI0037489D9F
MDAPARVPRRGGWEAIPRIVETTTLVILALAAAVAVVALAFEGSSLMGYLPPLLVVAGVALSYRVAYLGLGVVAVAPIVLVWSGSVPEATWSMVCFAALLLAFRGLPGLLVAGVLATVNFVSGAFVIGTVNLIVDATASVFAFAALVGAATGSALRSNVRYRQEVDQRIRSAEETRIASVDRGIAQERVRIARDLHDSVGHQVAVVSMRLGAAEVHLPPGAEESRADIEAARQALQAVLRETQQILTVLRIGADETPLGTSPGVRGLRELVSRFEAAGMTVETAIEDYDGRFTPEADIAAYRIVQESLTNANRYGDGSASLTVTADGSEAVRFEIVNLRGPRAAQASQGGGNGLVGMRERAASVGGTLDARVDGNLFWVTATLPAMAGSVASGTGTSGQEKEE